MNFSLYFFLILLQQLLPSHSQTCSSSNYNTATSDTIPDEGTVPALTGYTSTLFEEITLTSGYNYFYASWKGDIPGWSPGYNIETNTITITNGTYGEDNGNAVRTWNGTIMPEDDAEGLLKFYSTYDHSSDIWYHIRFEMRQSSDNVLGDDRDCYIKPKFGIFDINTLNKNHYPNNIGDAWASGPFCERKDGVVSCKELELNSDEDNAMLIQNDGGTGYVWITWDTERALDWTVFEATFKINETEDCDSCYPAFHIDNNGWPKWNRNISYQLRNLTIERLAGEAIWEEPITDFYHELVEIPRQDSLETEITGWDRNDCPHEWSNLYEWHDASTWDDNAVPTTSDDVIYIPENTNVIIRSCSLSSTSSDPYQRIYIPSTSSLIFDDADIDIYFKEIWVDGNLYVGNEECRIYSYINFYFCGTKDTSDLGTSTIFEDGDNPGKGIIVNGNIQIHGKQYHPTWTKLAISTYPNDDRIYLQESVNWEVGQQIVIVTSVFEDYQDNHQNEVRTIAAIGDSDWTSNNVIYFGDSDSQRLDYYHYVGEEYQTEVLLLTRRIKFEGIDNDDPYGYNASFGGHTRIQWDGIGQFRGIMAYHMGQQNVLARYPFHLHELGTEPDVLISDTTVWESFFRCWTIHGTYNATLERNIGYDIDGHCLYIEDGIEENNIIQYNAVAFVHPIGHAAAGTCFGGEYICSGCSSGSSWANSGNNYYYFSEDEIQVPADVGASAYYISNAYNIIRGNIASGGWAGFSFINMREPLGDYYGTGCGDYDCPYNRPTMEFDGNVAHSSGFYWGGEGSGCGSCFYYGGEMWFDEDESAYIYYTARVSHDEHLLDGNETWSQFTNLKAYLCDFGFNAWGSRMNVQYFETHDVERAIFFLGENSLQNAIINAYSDNIIGAYSLPGTRQGFQFYDTKVKTYMKDIEFRNFQYGEPVILFMTDSDHLTNQGNAAIWNIKYTNCDPDWHIVDYFCGEPCNEHFGVNNDETQGSRNQGMYDYDGSASRTRLPTIITTRRNWWSFNDDCRFDEDLNLHYCPWYEKYEDNTWGFSTRYHNLAYIQLRIDGLTDGQYEGGISGYFSQWGRNYSTPYSLFPGITGWSNIGWYFRSKYGAPIKFSIGDELQIPRKSFIVLAIRYPSNAVFDIYANIHWGSRNVTILEANSYEEITESSEDLYDDWSQWDCDSVVWWQMCTVTGGLGPKWYFDGEFLYLRIVNIFWYVKNFYQTIDDINSGNDYWEYMDMRMWDVSIGYQTYYINVKECNGCDETNEGYYDVTDKLPKQFPTQDWDKTGYWQNAPTTTAPPGEEDDSKDIGVRFDMNRFNMMVGIVMSIMVMLGWM